jgi:shikimate dehydrogenase
MRPRRFAVIGDPIAHSKSPVMHAAAFRALGLPHTYEAVRAAVDDLAGVLSALRAGRFDGLNVTVPHKQRVLAMVDVVDESARISGAANTLVRGEGGRIVAYNTDAPALAAEFRVLAGDEFPWTNARALVLGSGGAARAAVTAFAIHLGVPDIVVRARAFADEVRREAFVREAPCPLTARPWSALRDDRDDDAQILALVQATSAGMLGADSGEAAAGMVAWDRLASQAVAIDVVYAPRETPWLRAARARGIRCDDGLGMLARQGALALELWLEVPAPLGVMRGAIG